MPEIDDPGDSPATLLIECECPVCTRIKRVIEGVGQSQYIGDPVGLGIVEYPRCWPQHGSGAWRPNLDEASSLLSEKIFVDSWEGTAQDAKENVSDAEGGRLYIVGSDVWIFDGRRA